MSKSVILIDCKLFFKGLLNARAGTYQYIEKRGIPILKNHIELKNVSVSYDNIKTVINDFSLEIKEGEFTTLLGPSGCGKSTILRMIAGFVTPTGGQILLDGEDISRIPPYERPVNMVFQNYALFPHLNVFDNVAFGLKMKDLPKEEILKRVGEALEIVDLEGFEKRSVDTLSGGQQQRIAIARAIVNNPKVLLLDEPLSALDYNMRKEMQIELKRMHKELGITFVFVTHDQEEALTMSDKVVVMADGIIQQYGTPEKIYNEPGNIFVANFIGDCNLFDGSMSGDKEVAFGGARFACVDDYEVGSHVNVVIRPEDVDIVPEGAGRIDGVVTKVDFKGIFYVTYVEFGNYEMEVHTLKHLEPGMRVGMDVAADMIHIIPADVSVNRFEGVVSSIADGIAQITFDDFVLSVDCKTTFPEEEVEVQTAISAYFAPGDAVMSDDQDAGLVIGKISSLVYMGDRYSYVIRSESRTDYTVDDPDLWNNGDTVSISIPMEKFKLSIIKDEGNGQ